MQTSRTTKIFFLLITVILFFLPLLSTKLHAEEEIKRKVLSFYDPSISPDPIFSKLHEQGEIYLNFLGLTADYRSPYIELPSDEEMRPYRAVITWYIRPGVIIRPITYCNWLKRQMDNGIKVVILGATGLSSNVLENMPQECTSMFNTLGVDYRSNRLSDTLYLEFVKRDSSMVEYERKLTLTDSFDYSWIVPVDPSVKSYLTARRTDIDDSDSTLVFTSKNGGFVHIGYVSYQVGAGRMLWRINPYRYFSEVLQTRELPIADITTINNDRVFFSHIDGDGYLNVSHVAEGKYSGEIILNSVLKKYNTLPITVSLISGYFDMPQFKSESIYNSYLKTFSLPNVEVMAHGYAHPLNWTTGKISLQIPGYKFDPKKEIVDSLNQINAFLEKNGIHKKGIITSWTGNCRPNEAQIKIATDAGLLSINGGGARVDDAYLSQQYTRPFPMGLKRGDQIQVYTGSQNENVYTNLWKGPFYGYQKVIDTYKNTESPHRLKPINIYYHHYSAENVASLKAVTDAYNYALSQNIIPIRTSNYIRMVHDFYDLKIFKTATDSFRINSGGFIRTIRFDDETKIPDMTRSSGVIGFNIFQKSLYVFLDESKTHQIVMTAARPQLPYISQANFQITQFKSTPQKVSFSKQGWLESKATIANLIPLKNYSVSELKTQTLKTNSKGELNITFSSMEGDNPPTAVEITPAN